MSYLIIAGARVPLPDAVIEAGATASNYLDDGEPHLSNGPARTAMPKTLVLHETGGNSANGCKATLEDRGLGVHLILDKNGHISCHADLALEICWHAGRANATSIGIEIVNPYRPEVARDPHGEIIPAQWWTWVPKNKLRTYVTPTAAQMAVLLALVPWLCGKLFISYTFPTRDLNAKRPRIDGAVPGGVVAHRDFASHADGRYPLERLIAAAPV